MGGCCHDLASDDASGKEGRNQSANACRILLETALVQGYISLRPRTARLATKMKTIMTFLMLALVAGCGRSKHSTWSRTASQCEIGTTP